MVKKFLCLIYNHVMKAHDPAYLADAFLTSALTRFGELHSLLGERNLGTQWTWGWEDPKTGLDASKRRKISVSIGNWTTDWATPAPHLIKTAAEFFYVLSVNT
jgi:hypothetical protein